MSRNAPPLALFVSVLLMLGVAVGGIAAAAPDVAPTEREVLAEVDARNRAVLREILGDGFREDPTILTVVPGGPVAEGLPLGFAGVAQAGVRPATGTLREQCPEPAGPEEKCKVRRLADGTDVVVHSQPMRVLDGGLALAALAVHLIQPDGNLVQVSVGVTGPVTHAADTPGLTQQLGTWLDQFERKLLRAAADPRMGG